MHRERCAWNKGFITRRVSPWLPYFVHLYGLRNIRRTRFASIYTYRYNDMKLPGPSQRTSCMRTICTRKQFIYICGSTNASLWCSSCGTTTSSRLSHRSDTSFCRPRRSRIGMKIWNVQDRAGGRTEEVRGRVSRLSQRCHPDWKNELWRLTKMWRKYYKIAVRATNL